MNRGPDELSERLGHVQRLGGADRRRLNKMNEAAQDDDQEEFDAAAESLQHHGAENDEAAKEIGATDCAGS